MSSSTEKFRITPFVGNEPALLQRGDETTRLRGKEADRLATGAGVEELHGENEEELIILSV